MKYCMTRLISACHYSKPLHLSHELSHESASHYTTSVPSDEIPNDSSDIAPRVTKLNSGTFR